MRVRYIIYTALVACFCCTVHSARGQFVNAAQDLGITHINNSYGCGAGLSLVDMNNDGLPDITLPTAPGAPLQLYIQQTDGSYQLSQDPAILGLTDSYRSISWVDYDNDGDRDFFGVYISIVIGSGGTTTSGMKLLEQLDDGTFQDITEQVGLPAFGPRAYSHTWADINLDGHLDLHIGTKPLEGWEASMMFLGNEFGTFTDVAAELGLEDIQGIPFNSVFFQADDDLELELFTANDKSISANRFYDMQDGVYQDITVEAGLNHFINAMGVDVADYDRDGDFDLYVTNNDLINPSGLLGNQLYVNNGDLTFTTVQDFPSNTNNGTYWGCNFIDFNLDRNIDLYTVNGNRTPGARPSTLFMNLGFGEWVTYSGEEFNAETGVHFGSAQADLNGDLIPDLVVLDVFAGGTQVWIAPPTDNQSISVSLEGLTANREGIGSVIEVWIDGDRTIDMTTCGNSYGSQDGDDYIFGVGQASLVDSVVIRWPKGDINRIHNVPAGMRMHVLQTAVDEPLDCIPSGNISIAEYDILSYTFSLMDTLNIDTAAGISWQINGEQFGQGFSLDHTLDSAGTYIVTATLTSDCGYLFVTDTLEAGCVPPQASFEIESTDLQALCTSTSQATTLAWTVQGQVVAQDTTAFLLEAPAPGDYTLCQVVADACGLDTLCQSVALTCTTASPLVSLTTPDYLEIQAQVTAPYDSLLWSTGDGFSILSDSLDYVYSMAGTYELCVTAYDLCGQATFCDSIEMLCPMPQASFTWMQEDSLLLVDQTVVEADSIFWSIDNQPFNLIAGEPFSTPDPITELCMHATSICGTVSFCDTLVLLINGLYEQVILDSEQLQVFPNPFGEQLQLSTTHDARDIQIYDGAARLVYSQDLQATDLSNVTLNIDSSAWPKGLYWLVLTLDDGTRLGQRLIKEH